MRYPFKRTIMTAMLACGISATAHADFNLINVDLNSPQNQQLSQMYGDSYGFQPAQAAPALLGPAEETPGILKIAQAAGTVPASVWMMRKMGMSYSSILQTFGLGPMALLGGGIPAVPSAPIYPNWLGSRSSSFSDALFVQSARYVFLRDVLQVNPMLIPQIPFRGIEYQRALLMPVLPGHGYWMPPGIAKKYGWWMPPGQAKKYGYGEWIERDGKWGWDRVSDDDDHIFYKKKDKHWKKEAKAEKHHDDDDGGHGHGKGGGNGKGHGGHGKGKSK